MKTLLAILILGIGAGLGAMALDPQRDALCIASQARDAVRERHAKWHCIHYAAARNDAAAIRASLDDGVAIDRRTERGQTSLNIAAQYGSYDAVRTLIARNAELEARDGANGFTALHWAAERYHPAIARALIAAGAQVDAANKWQQTPLWIAAWQPEQGNTEIAHILVHAGADIARTDHKANTPLLMAAVSGHRPMVDYLLSRGAAIDARNNQGRTPLFQAVNNRHGQTVRLLLARGANPNTQAAGVAPLAKALENGDQNIADLLVANGATGYEQYAARAAMARGKKAYRAQDYETAIQAFSAAIALGGDDSDPYYRRALAFKARGAYQDAEMDLRQALTLDDRHDEAREALARLYVDDGRHDRARTALERLIEHDPNNARALYLLAESHDALGEASRAGTLFAKACDLGFQPACQR